MNHGAARPPGWALPLGVLLALVAFLPLSLGGWREDRAVLDVQNELELESVARLAGLARTEAPLSVVALGHSLLRCAVADAPLLETSAAAQGLELAWARLLRRGAGTVDWQELIRRTIAAQPDLVLVEQRFASLREEVDVLGWRLGYLARCARAQLGRSLEGPTAWGEQRTAGLLVDRFPGDDVPAELALRTAAAYRAAVARGRELGVAAFAEVLTSPARTLPLADLVRACRANDIEVVLLEVPLHRSASRAAAVAVSASDAATARLVAEHGVQHWPCELELDLGDYLADRAHLSESGRTRYTRWLLARLATYTGGQR